MARKNPLRRPKKKKRPYVVAGSAPGTIRVDPDALATSVTAWEITQEKLTFHERPDAATLTRLHTGPALVWVDVVGLGTEETLRTVAKTFGMHPLQLEDVLNIRHRPKIEHIGDHYFIITRFPHLGEEPYLEQISIFFGQSFVLTFQERPGDGFGTVRERLKAPESRLRRSGADFLAYALLDAAVDHYFPLIEDLDDHAIQLEDEVLTKPGEDLLPRLMEVKATAQRLRRNLAPLRDTFRHLSHERSALIRPDSEHYLRDVEDHLVRAVEQLDQLRDHAINLVGVHLSVVSTKMNEVMKVLTIIATIFMPLGFIAGVYGMNFDPSVSPYNMPELGWYWGYPFALGLMTTVAVGFVVYFLRRGWLTR